MSPFEIGVLLHYHVCPEDHPKVREVAPYMFNSLLSEGLLVPGGTDHEGNPRVYSLTDLGHAYCHALQLTPIPVVQWVIPAQPERLMPDAPVPPSLSAPR